MYEATSLSVSVTSDFGRKSKKFVKMLTLEKVIDWINHQGLDEYTAKGLVEIASNYPSHALPSFRKNFNLMVSRVRAKRTKEVDSPPKTIKSKIPETKEQFFSFENALNATWADKQESKQNEKPTEKNVDDFEEGIEVPETVIDQGENVPENG